MLPFLHFFIKAEAKIHFQEVKLTRLKFKQKRIQEYIECEITTQIVTGKQGIDVFVHCYRDLSHTYLSLIVRQVFQSHKTYR